MENFRYLHGVTTLQLDTEACVGCGMCESVCPHTVFQMKGKKAEIEDLDGCMECGACARNCPTGAIRVTPGDPGRWLCILYHSDMDQGKGSRLVQWRGMLLTGGHDTFLALIYRNTSS